MLWILLYSFLSIPILKISFENLLNTSFSRITVCLAELNQVVTLCLDFGEHIFS